MQRPAIHLTNGHPVSLLLLTVAVAFGFSANAQGQLSATPEPQPTSVLPPAPAPVDGALTAVVPVVPVAPVGQLNAATAESLKKQVVSGEGANADKEAAESSVRRLVESGVTVGVAYAIQISTTDELPSEPSTDQVALLDGAEATALPYVAVFPAYWAYSPEAKHYCATDWGFGYERGQSAALAQARVEARRLVEHAIEMFMAGIGESEVARVWKIAGRTEGVSDEARAQLASQLKALVSTGRPDERVLESIVVSLSASRWQPGLAGACGWTKLGVYVGFPANFDATALSGTKDDPTWTTRELKPFLSFGVVLAPNAMFSLLGGFTYSRFEEVDGQRPSVWSYTLGLGGNVDLVTSLVSK